MISLRNRKRLLWAADAVLLAALGICGYYAAAVPVDIASPDDTAARAEHADGGPEQSADAPEEKTLAYYAVIGERNLRRELFPREKAAPAAKKKPLPFTLTGTAVSGDGATAFLRTRNGEVKMAGAGETVEGAKITAIHDDRIDVEFNGEQKTLTIAGEGGRR